jgi:hypothetical protein
MVMVGIDRRLRGRAGGITGDNLLRVFLSFIIAAENSTEKMLCGESRVSSEVRRRDASTHEKKTNYTEAETR